MLASYYSRTTALESIFDEANHRQPTTNCQSGADLSINDQSQVIANYQCSITEIGSYLPVSTCNQGDTKDSLSLLCYDRNYKIIMVG